MHAFSLNEIVHDSDKVKTLEIVGTCEILYKYYISACELASAEEISF